MGDQIPVIRPDDVILVNLRLIARMIGAHVGPIHRLERPMLKGFAAWRGEAAFREGQICFISHGDAGHGAGAVVRRKADRPGGGPCVCPLGIDGAAGNHMHGFAGIENFVVGYRCGHIPIHEHLPGGRGDAVLGHPFLRRRQGVVVGAEKGGHEDIASRAVQGKGEGDDGILPRGHDLGIPVNGHMLPGLIHRAIHLPPGKALALRGHQAAGRQADASAAVGQHVHRRQDARAAVGLEGGPGYIPIGLQGDVLGHVHGIPGPQQGGGVPHFHVPAAEFLPGRRGKAAFRQGVSFTIADGDGGHGAGSAVGVEGDGEGAGPFRREVQICIHEQGSSRLINRGHILPSGKGRAVGRREAVFRQYDPLSHADFYARHGTGPPARREIHVIRGGPFRVNDGIFQNRP